MASNHHVKLKSHIVMLSIAPKEFSCEILITTHRPTGCVTVHFSRVVLHIYSLVKEHLR